MADLSDVSNAIGALVSATLYPSGAASENASPLCGWPVSIAAGWPRPQALDKALNAGKVSVSIFPRAGERNTTRYPDVWVVGDVQPTTFTLSAQGLVLTVGGTPPPTFMPQNLGVFINGRPYIVQSRPASNTATLAEALAELILADIPAAAVSGATITLPADARVGPLRVGATANGLKEVRRQERQWQITIWAPSADARSAVSKAIDPVLADTPFLTLADTTRGRLTYHGTLETDGDQTQGVFRRDLIYTVEYATTRCDLFAQILALQADLRDEQGELLKSTIS